MLFPPAGPSFSLSSFSAEQENLKNYLATFKGVFLFLSYLLVMKNWELFGPQQVFMSLKTLIFIESTHSQLTHVYISLDIKANI